MKLVSEETYSRDQVIDLVDQVLKNVEGSNNDESENGTASILAELASLKQIIESAKKGLSVSGAEDIQVRHIPTATDELDAVNGTIEQAAGAIMDACEEIQSIAKAEVSDDICAKIDEKVTTIFEACSFQDISGQRITKVVSTLQEIDTKISELLGNYSADPLAKTEKTPDVNDPDSLLNGPQLAKDAPSQEDIDSILAQFD